MTAENGFEAIELVKEHPPDYFAAIFLDINMPIINGFEACKSIYKLLNEGNELPINQPLGYRHWSMRKSRTLLVCLSGDSSEITRSEILKHPFDHTFTSLSPDEI